MKFLIIATAAAVAFAPAAFAAPGGNGNGNGNGKARVTGAANANGVWTNPAGKTHPHGMPPGQAKKLGVGGVLPSTYPGYRVVTDYRNYRLPAAPTGYQYARVGNDVYLRQTTTGVISRVIENLIQ